VQHNLQDSLRAASFAEVITDDAAKDRGERISIFAVTAGWAPSFARQDRPVRARMTIDRPYSEISGNIYGTNLDDLPTSFISVFENGVGRALFCGNPAFSHDSATYVDDAGAPICILRSRFELQKHRVRVSSIDDEGSIIVNFYLVRNETATQPSAPRLFEALQRQVQSNATPLAHDMEFSRFARAATLEEIPLSELEANELLEVARAESLRKPYNEHNMCNLQRSAKEGQIKCKVGGGGRHGYAGPRLAVVLGTVTFAVTS